MTTIRISALSLILLMVLHTPVLSAPNNIHEYDNKNSASGNAQEVHSYDETISTNTDKPAINDYGQYSIGNFGTALKNNEISVNGVGSEYLNPHLYTDDIPNGYGEGGQIAIVWGKGPNAGTGSDNLAAYVAKMCGGFADANFFKALKNIYRSIKAFFSKRKDLETPIPEVVKFSFF